METSLQAAIDAGKINGAVICATDSEGHFIYNKALGERTLLSGDKKPQQLDDVLYIASATKLITTIAALQCVEDGLLTLDGDLSTIAPDLTAKEILTGFADDGTPQLEPPARPITLKMLLTHSSGLCYYFMNPLIAKWRKQLPITKPTPLPVEERFNYPLIFQPGEAWTYGPSLDWAGRIVERATGGTLLEYMQRRLFDPLDIKDAQFYPVIREDLRARLVDLTPTDRDAAGQAVLGGGGVINLRGRGDFGGQGLFMTGVDFAKVLRSLLANDGKMLRPATVDDMFRHQLSPEATDSYSDALASPGGVSFRVGIGAEMKAGYGFGGLLTLGDVEGWYGERTLTWGGGHTLTWFVDRKNDLCGVGAVQAALPLDNDLMDELKHTFRHDVYCKRVAWREEQLNGMVGREGYVPPGGRVFDRKM
ncbi:Beta-lactamase-like protein [Penicillium paradoxum]|uniref:Beta-lactamase-like protein n=1 Tax=Penicillium paradoxum TaxID=176176 RepID=UPI0025467388|nr:Beta-lactamase-like protein [Penicillium paradoxum]KAJ5780329.1 Beta-lactamase-like protein [Penicillium paradoxum]